VIELVSSFNQPLLLCFCFSALLFSVLKHVIFHVILELSKSARLFLVELCEFSESLIIDIELLIEKWCHKGFLLSL
jgi:hypothetical protein